jgi:hypothetical protein
MRVNSNAVMLSGSLGADAETGTSDGTAFARASAPPPPTASAGAIAASGSGPPGPASSPSAMSPSRCAASAWVPAPGPRPAAPGGRERRPPVPAPRGGRRLHQVHPAMPPGLEPVPAVEDGTLVRGGACLERRRRSRSNETLRPSTARGAHCPLYLLLSSSPLPPLPRRTARCWLQHHGSPSEGGDQ